MKYDSIAVGKRIAELRKQLGYSQEAFAEELFVTRSLLSKIETGVRNPTISMLIDIADIADVSIDYLIRGNSELRRIKAELLDAVVGLEAIIKRM